MRRIPGIEPTSVQPDHFGLAYQVWAPTGPDGELPKGEDAVDVWFDTLQGNRAPPDYSVAFERWCNSFTHGHHTIFQMVTRSRVLVGHGDPAPTEIGIAVHHTWGVPIVPGSALKGLLAHYIHTCYGPDKGNAGQSQVEDEEQRLLWASAAYQQNRLVTPPGAHYTKVFGRSAVDSLSARRGKVTIHDGLWIPSDEPIWNRDVLMPHHRSYYRQPDDNWPNDHDEPNPVPFITVNAGARFLMAISCPDVRVRELVARCLEEALSSWGIGAKTAAGYGRLERYHIANTESSGA